MRAEIMHPGQVGRPGAVGRFQPAQIAQRSTWNRLPDEPTNFSAMSVIRVHPVNGSTVVTLNPTDPGTVEGGQGEWIGEQGPGWLMPPGGYGQVAKHR